MRYADTAFYTTQPVQIRVSPPESLGIQAFA
uniref:Uncharacterized protein n=1 Tax=Myoviridae sp. ctkOm7 TaxID=2826690 RepID=A0A8S5NMV4_9CAUD|nr:MAG TPA: hypothetical protein [Myoviridae sp. ctkOm7]